MLIIAVVVGVSIKVTKSRLDNILSYTYYSTYSTLRSVTANMLADFNLKDEIYQANFNDYKTKISYIIKGLINQPAVASSDTPICIVQPSRFTYEAAAGACVSYDATAYNGTSPLGCDMSVTSGIFSFKYTYGGVEYDGACGYNRMKQCCNATIMANSEYWLTCDAYGGDYGSCEPEPEPEPEPTPDTPVTPSVCNTEPEESEVSAKYCLGKEFDSTPEVCGWVDINPWPPACETGKEWSAEHCQCVAIPASIPKKGANFCELFERLVNISSSDSVCAGDAIADDTEDFSGKIPDLILRNGVRLYNVHQNPDLIPELKIADAGSGSSEINEQSGYTIYADVDGIKGSSLLWEDVFPFYITLSGKVIPAYDNGSGADSEKHMQVSVRNESFSLQGSRVLRWLSKGVSFKEAACQAGFVNSKTPYCDGTEYDMSCSSVNSGCILKPIRPIKFF